MADRERVSCEEFVRRCLIREIEDMLIELGRPPLIDRMFPNGWHRENETTLRGLFDLCLRTFRDRKEKEV